MDILMKLTNKEAQLLRDCVAKAAEVDDSPAIANLLARLVAVEKLTVTND